MMLVMGLDAAVVLAAQPSWWEKVPQFIHKVPARKIPHKAPRTHPVTELIQRQMQEQGYDAAMATGCWKSDSPPLQWPLAPAGKMLTVGGILYYKANGMINTHKDQCVAGHPEWIEEGYCKPAVETGGNVVLKPVTNKIVTCPTGTACGGAGIAAACLKMKTPSGPPDALPTNGCLVGQLPFLDSNADGVSDTCMCPVETVALDTNGDLNADTCGKLKPGMKIPPCEELLAKDWGKFDWDGDGVANSADLDDDDDGLPDANDTDGFTEELVKSVLGGANGGSLYDFCENPFAIRHVFCSLNGLQTSSLTQCAGSEVCEKGNCIPSESSVCKPTKVEPSPTVQGYVTIVPSGGAAFPMVDKCYSDQEDPAHAYVAKVHCQGAIGGAGYGAMLCPTGYSCQWDDPSAKTSGICKPKDAADTDWDDDGTPNATDPDADLDGDGKPNAQDADDDGDGANDDNDSASCVRIVDNTCEEVTDSQQSPDPLTGLIMFGNPFVLGTVKTSKMIIQDCPDLPPLDTKEYDHDDTCKWDETKLLPDLYQFGCVGEKLGTTITQCDWSQGVACDWKATVPEERGICKPKLQAPDVQCTTATATMPGHCTGTNAFNHPVDHTDECMPIFGPKIVKRWKMPTVKGSSVEGAVAVYEACPDLHFCQNGICVPEPCFDKSYNDNDPCTEDSCDPISGTPLFLPIPIDDNNYCTLDSCVDNNGAPMVTHQPITTGNCAGWAYCQDPANQAKPECANATPQNDPSGGFDCAPCAANTYAAQHPECAQCTQTIEYCFDDDTPNQIQVKGKVVKFPGIKGKEAMGHDLCIGLDKNTGVYTGVMEVACGPNLTFYYSSSACPPTMKGCVDGACVPQ